jgi:hypothetical protein
MTVIERQQCKSQLTVLEDEIRSLENLIRKREKWLADSMNKRKSTFKAVQHDTEEMQKELKELKEEYQEKSN